ncbi:hypothetical protein [Cupriavidus necator]|uniref:hypothetical protein n=1 Tax=Cupriavidus necator TaxID=106590 RepID=UPI001E40F27C|nr:hypothetical protein [Cupriavidus necator]
MWPAMRIQPAPKAFVLPFCGLSHDISATEYQNRRSIRALARAASPLQWGDRMTRLTGHVAACITISLLLTASAQASDIACKNALRQPAVRCDDPLATGNACRRADTQPTAATLICDYAMLHSKHEYIHAEQQRLLRAGVIEQDDVAAWRRRRDACTSVACLDSVFASWRAHKSHKPITRAAGPQPKAPDAPMRNVSKNMQPPAAPKMMAPPATRLATPLPASQPAPQPPPPPVVDTELRQYRAHPVVTDRISPDPVPMRTSTHPAQAPRPRGWESLGTLAWLGVCGAGFACWSRKMRGEWLPGATRLRERTRNAPPIVLAVAALLVLNGILLLCILTESQPVP